LLTGAREVERSASGDPYVFEWSVELRVGSILIKLGSDPDHFGFFSAFLTASRPTPVIRAAT
jgi:hypothetical protein